ncbi:MAG: sigma-54-dependent Fis family transcriptional regulator [Planctomycetales bacterium]
MTTPRSGQTAASNPLWMKWDEVPWLARGEENGGLIRLAESVLAAATNSRDLQELVRRQLLEIANEFSLQWTGLLTKSPEWKVTAEFGKRGAAELPLRWLEEALDRDLCGFQAGEGSLGWIVVPLGDGEVWLLQGRMLTAEQLPAACAIGRALGWAIRLRRTLDQNTARIGRLRSTLQISSRFGTEKESEPLLELIAKEATRMLKADRASIFMWEPERHEVVAVPALGVKGNSLRLPDNTGIVGEVIQTGRAARVDNAYQDPKFHRGVDQKSGYQTHNLLCVPLIEGTGQRIGAFEVLNKLDGNFTAEDEESLQELGMQAAIALQRTFEREELVRRHRQLTEQVTQGVEIVGESPAVVALRGTIDRLAATDLPVLILGESGTGKEVIAQSLHYRGTRREHPFIAVNCAALTETLLESELFGHEKGAFTDAHEARQGKFELAQGGRCSWMRSAICHSGAGEMLRVLEQKVITRVGGSQNIPINVRIVAATNAKLSEQVRAKKFREDLYYRLSVVTLELPALRDRPEDILLLAEFFLAKFCQQARRKTLTLSPEARRRLQAHGWPGNIRELRNLMERVAFLTTGDRVEGEDLAFILAPDREPTPGAVDNAPLNEATSEFQRQYIRRAIKRVRQNMSEAARMLGLHRSNLYRKMRQLGMTEAPPETEGEDDVEELAQDA